jgi:predicted amidophosphoribosyltransferase
MILIDALLHFVFPSCCSHCGSCLDGDQALCKGCFSELKWFDEVGCCIRCLSGVDPDETLCLACKRGFFYPDKLMITLESNTYSQKIGRNLNHKNVLKIAASLMVIKLVEQHTIFDGIVAMPGSKELAKEISTQTQIPLHSRKLESSNWLIIGDSFHTHSALNHTTVALQKKIYGKISFLFLV